MPHGEMKLDYSSEAKSDLWKIGAYIVEQGGYSSSAKSVVNAIQDDADRLLDHPYLGIDIKFRIPVKTDYQMLVSGGYHIFYRVEGHNIIIVRILHGSQDWMSILFG